MQFVFCTQLCTEKHVHFATPDDVMALILFNFFTVVFYDKKKERKEYSKCTVKISIHCFCFYKMLINAVAAQEYML